MIFFGTNDPYWTIDAVKHYINEIPGNNLLHYVANAGHSFGDKNEVNSLSAFFALILNNKPLPVCTWSLQEKKNRFLLTVKITPDQFVRAVLWTSNSNTRDFREATWTPADKNFLSRKDKSTIQVKLKYPKTGFSAFYVDLFYLDDKGGEYSISTRAYVADTKQVFVD